MVRKEDRWTDRWLNGQRDRWMYGPIRRMDLLVDRPMDGWIGRQMG